MKQSLLILCIIFSSVYVSAQTETHTIKLSEVSKDIDYGFSEDQPIKVGKAAGGGPANQHTYLRSLRDGKGKQIQYKRLGSCCAYESKNGMMGTALVDKYEITFKNKKGKKKKKLVYLSFYDYEEPLILFGFTAI